MMRYKNSSRMVEDFNKGRLYVPLSIFNNYIKLYLVNEMSKPALNFIQEEIEEHKLPDVKSSAHEDMIRFDQIMLSVFVAKKMTLENNFKYYEALAGALDLTNRGAISFETIKIFYKLFEREVFNPSIYETLKIIYCRFSKEKLSKFRDPKGKISSKQLCKLFIENDIGSK